MMKSRSMQWKQHESEQDQIFLDLFNVTVLCLTEEVVALHDPVSGVIVGGADDAGPGHVGARGGGRRGAVLLPGREGAHVVVLHTSDRSIVLARSTGSAGVGEQSMSSHRDWVHCTART